MSALDQRNVAPEHLQACDFNDNWENLIGSDLQTTSSSIDVACQHLDAVRVDFVARVASHRDHLDGPVVQMAGDWLVVIGEKYASPALEMGIRFMEVGQTASIWSNAKYAYGFGTRKHGQFQLPPDTSIRYEVTVKSIASVDEEDPESLKLQLGESQKQIGNDIFRNECSKEPAAKAFDSQQGCLRLYDRAAEEMLYLLQISQCTDIQNQASAIMIDCLNNIVSVHMRAHEYHKAKEAAVTVLTHDPSNVRALLRAARAAMLDPAGTFEEAEAALDAAEEMSGGEHSPDIANLKEHLARRKQQYRKKTKAMFRKMRKSMH